MSSLSTTPNSSRTVQAVIIRCGIDQHTSGLSQWSSITIPADHPVFWQPVPPLAQRLNIPIAIHREGTKSPNRADLDNQIATYLAIDPESGFAPLSWQSGVGTVIVARKDRKPFLLQHLEVRFDYTANILDRFGDGDGPPLSMYNWQAFDRWWKRSATENKEDQFEEGTSQEPDNDWVDVKSPYEV
ncbi:hypothetical protein S40285_10673 [Stachybotrys chlorohalonatus IBT 40285]|uniref:Uncharacterized protein n=1 Tax=Stachybotrys chlorohalonatus (strain IBT 40285) TaxID=1283841 RepID=A0A084QW20_STAC4|nr:hypothetical protein S40285_10673 [Stachybotrys chlorohalonata IBT 40285]